MHKRVREDVFKIIDKYSEAKNAYIKLINRLLAANCSNLEDYQPLHEEWETMSEFQALQERQIVRYKRLVKLFDVEDGGCFAPQISIEKVFGNQSLETIVFSEHASEIVAMSVEEANCLMKVFYSIEFKPTN